MSDNFLYFAVSRDKLEKDYPRAKMNLNYEKGFEFILHEYYVSSKVYKTAGDVLNYLKYVNCRENVFICKAELMENELYAFVNEMLAKKANHLTVLITEMIEVNL